MIEFQTLGNIWIELAVFGLTLLVFVISVRSTRHQALKLRLLVASLRFAMLAFGLLLLHHPSWSRQTVIPKEQRMAVLIDRSGSMGAGSAEGKNRYERAFELVTSLNEDSVKLDIFPFDQVLGDAYSGKARPGKLSGNKTDYYNTLSQLFSDHDDYTAVLLLSDGHDLGRFSQMASQETTQWLERLRAPPINSLLVGDQLDGPEIAIHSIDAPSFSFVRAPLTIRATVLVRNLDNHQSQVQLLEGEKVLKIQDLHLDEQGFGTVEFEYYPETQGEHLFTILVPAHHRESNVENNRQQTLIEIGRDKISVLHIAGSVTWDLQGLRAMFERDPLVDLTAFYIMRTREHIQLGVDNRQIPADEMALVPFPTEEIFDRQLFSFDVVVFHDFDAGTYFSDSYQARRLLTKIREFVTEHRGGFVVVGGPRTAGGPSLGLSPLAEILPLIPPIHRLAYSRQTQISTLTEHGKNHPILRTFDASLQNFEGSMGQLSEHQAANVLVRSESNQPLLATAEAGNGRTLFLNTSSSWKWRRDAIAAGGTGEPYYDFWEQTLKWVIADPALDRVRITATKTVANPLAVEVDVQLRNKNYEPVGGQTTSLSVQPLDNVTESWQVPFTTNAEGLAHLQIVAPRPGYYRLSLSDPNWKRLARTHTLFLGGSQQELRNLDLVPETLQRLASHSGGHFFTATENFDSKKLARGEVRHQTIAQTQRLKLRNWIWCLPLLLLIGVVEWALRRSSHLA